MPPASLMHVRQRAPMNHHTKKITASAAAIQAQRAKPTRVAFFEVVGCPFSMAPR